MTDIEKRQVAAGGGSPGSLPIDPSENVKALTDAAVKRLDDMAALREKLANSQIKSLKQEMRWQDKIANLREQCAHEKDELKATFAEKSASQESARLDAIRAVDQLAVSTAAAQSFTAIQTLAVNQAKDTETLRLAVANTATTLATQNAAQNAEFSRKIAALEQYQYENKGKTGMSDPMMASLSEDMKAVAAALAGGKGRNEGFSTSWAILIAVVVIIIAYLGLKQNQIAQPTVPQPIYITPMAAPTPK
jgi:hypothetical protein